MCGTAVIITRAGAARCSTSPVTRTMGPREVGYLFAEAFKRSLYYEFRPSYIFSNLFLEDLIKTAMTTTVFGRVWLHSSLCLGV